MTEASKPVSPPSVTVRVIVHLNDGRSLAELIELAENVQPSEEIVFHIWEDTTND